MSLVEGFIGRVQHITKVLCLPDKGGLRAGGYGEVQDLLGPP